jgi:hypothetical protein
MTLISDELRREVVQRAGGSCEYCRLPQATQVATFPVDHVTPVSLGGQADLANLALACRRCNAAKWTHTVASDPETGELVPLFHPRRNRWMDHFQWSEADPTWLEARSPEARATIGLLDLNSHHRRQVRHWLAVLGLHPYG